MCSDQMDYLETTRHDSLLVCLLLPQWYQQLVRCSSMKYNVHMRVDEGDLAWALNVRGPFLPGIVGHACCFLAADALCWVCWQ